MFAVLYVYYKNYIDNNCSDIDELFYLVLHITNL